MNLDLFKNKFLVLKEFEKKLPAISTGLEVLVDLNKKIKLDKNIKTLSLSNKVTYYDFINHSFNEYHFDFFNEKLTEVYNNNVVNNKVILYNKLYWILCTILEKNIKNFYC